MCARIINSPATILQSVKDVLIPIAKDKNSPLLLQVSSSLILTLLQVHLESEKTAPGKDTFEDLAGIDAQKDVFQKLSPILQDKDKYKKASAYLPDAYLLGGPKGTGKRALVYALANESKVAFFMISATKVARGEKKELLRITRIFNEAKASHPSIILIENAEAIVNTSKDNSFLAQILEEIEDCKREGCMVVVIATTNKPDIVDPAFMTTNVFFERLDWSKPDKVSRQKMATSFLKKYLREEDKEAICHLVATNTIGLVGKDIKHVVINSIGLAIKRGDDHVTRNDVIQALADYKKRIKYREEEHVVTQE